MTDTITEIGIDAERRLYIKPAKEKFPMIYRTASGVYWDAEKGCLYSARPQEWSYFDWYRHIINTVASECNCRLQLTPETVFVNIPEDLKRQLQADKS